MKLTQITVICLTFCLSCLIAAQGQTGGGAQQPDYTLGADDLIEITVANHKDLDRFATILPDGTFTMPPIGEIHASGLTPKVLATQIQTDLEKTYNNCSVLISVKEIHSRRVRILGAVRAPGVFDLKPNWRLIDLVAAAGGLSTRPERVAGRIVRQGADVLPLDLAQVMTNPDSGVDLKLQVDDLVLLDEKPQGQVFVMGQVMRPGAYDLADNATVLSVLSQAGNPTDLAALTKASILRNGTRIPINLRSIIVNGQNDDSLLQLKLQPGDLLFLPETEGHYSVMGQVAKPGAYALPDTEPRTVLQAINIAGGGGAGDMSHVGVIRTVDGKSNVIQINADELLKHGKLSQDIALQTGDIVYVPARRTGHPFQWQDVLSPLSLLGVLGMHF